MASASACGIQMRRHPPDHLNRPHSMRNGHDRVAVHALSRRPFTPLRSTARVESTRTPSRSKRMAEQEKVGISLVFITTVRARAEGECPQLGAFAIKSRRVILSAAKDLSTSPIAPQRQQVSGVLRFAQDDTQTRYRGGVGRLGSGDAPAIAARSRWRIIKCRCRKCRLRALPTLARTSNSIPRRSPNWPAESRVPPTFRRPHH